MYGEGRRAWGIANDVMAGVMLASGSDQKNGLFIYPGTKFVCSQEILCFVL